MGRSKTSCESPPRAPEPQPPKKIKKQPPQEGVDQLWEAFTTKYPGKVHSILPHNVYAETKAARTPKGIVRGEKAGKSYDEAAAECKAAVEKISKECRRVNMKYRDPHFDIEFDLKWNVRDCLDGLVRGESTYELSPKSVKRVTQIFEDPVFFLEGATASDVRQGGNGDCWFMSALCALGGKQDLIDKTCVARDEKVGVYGFVFHRDGEWIQTIIDDKLYLIASDWDESMEEKFTWQQINRADAEEEYRKSNQTGSRALYFAQCRSDNETWLPLLEKAYAKAHGDYNSIQGGFTGEAIEDLTGGVTTELFVSDILDTDKFWTDEIMKVNEEFLFGCYTGLFDNWQGASWLTDRKDIVSMHAYSILEAKEIKGERLLRVRNPWGKFEWKGPWSDGSEQWTPEWMQLLDHKFGDDGMFWISYKDLLRKYQSFDRTRLFGPEWSITQQWTTLDVPWSADYNDTKFSITLTTPSPVVIVLSKLDDRYFQGLEGQYDFSLHFRLEKDGEGDYIVRSHGNYLMNRSVSVDLDLEPGTYSVLMRVTADRIYYRDRPEQVIRDTCRDRRNKLIQIGLAYDLAHAKGQIKETDAEKKAREDREARKKAADHKKRRAELRAKWLKDWEIEKKRVARQKRHEKKKKAHDRKVEARKAARASDMSKEGITGEQDANAGAVDDPSAEQEPSKPTEVQAQTHLPTTDGIVEPEAGEEQTPAVDTTEAINGVADGEILKATDTSTEDAAPATQTDDKSKSEDDQTLAADGTETKGQSDEQAPAEASTEAAKSTIDDKDQSKVEELKTSEAEGANGTPAASQEAAATEETKPLVDPSESTKSAAEVPSASDNDPAAEVEQADGVSKADFAASEKAANFEAALRNVPSVVVNGAAATDNINGTAPGTVVGTALVAGTIPPPSTAATDNNDWEYDSLASFDSSMDTDLDLSPTPPPEVARDFAAGVPPLPGPEEENENQEFEDDPWNAVCVVGLRVYSHDKNTTIQIVRPKSEIEGETELDVDDNSKGASGGLSTKAEEAAKKKDDDVKAEINVNGAEEEKNDDAKAEIQVNGTEGKKDEDVEPEVKVDVPEDIGTV